VVFLGDPHLYDARPVQLLWILSFIFPNPLTSPFDYRILVFIGQQKETEMNTAIAQHLNIPESAIIRIEEWANVLLVVIRRLGARFVSKKVVKKVKAMLKNSASFLEMKNHLITVGIWADGVKSCSIHGVLQSWINSQNWVSSDMESLLAEVNQRLESVGIPPSYGVRECWDSIVSHKLEANGLVFTFR
jgi:hypothetical protein